MKAIVHQPRSYQLEMLHESLKGNIVVTMDTGSGKTNVAVLRIREELKRCSSSQLIWFLCPSVDLTMQQQRVIATQLPAVRSRTLVGNDGVDHWGSSAIWHELLGDVQVVVSTYQVLLSALQNDFVAMSRLALLVVDEAHHCAKGSAMNRIMKDFYHTEKRAGRSVPAVLGLTATPTIKSSIQDLDVIQSNLDAICRSPRATLEELKQCVHRPQMKSIIYEPSITVAGSTCGAFISAFQAANIDEDPWVIQLRDTGQGGSRKYLDAVLKRKTWCQGQLRSVYANATTLHQELGSWASGNFLSQCHANVRTELVRHFLNPPADKLRQTELTWLAQFFADANVPEEPARLPTEAAAISNKVVRSLELLQTEMRPGVSAIVFVQTKATVDYLGRLLQARSETRSILRVGSVVGRSHVAGKPNNISDVSKRDWQTESSIEDLRTGAKNLVICTSVAEEGLDISACNLVICFEKPPNMKSFVQRRGRARAKLSKFITLFSEAETHELKQLIDTEKAMKEFYTKDMRILEERAQKEELYDTDTERRILRARTGNANITWDDAVGRLHHFCDKLPSTRFGNSQPVYQFEGDIAVTCIITLPTTLDASIRTFSSSQAWRTERLAKKDAAFVAYSTLYSEGLLNEHLLPHAMIDSEITAATAGLGSRDGEIDIAPAYDPMEILARAWSDTNECFRYLCKIPERGMCFYMSLPIHVRSLTTLDLFIDQQETIHVEFHFQEGCDPAETGTWANRTTQALLWAMFQSRMSPTAANFPILFSPYHDKSKAESWLATETGLAPVQTLLLNGTQDIEKPAALLVRPHKSLGKPLKFLGLEYHLVKSKDNDGHEENMLCVKCAKLPSRTDFLRPVPVEVQIKTDAPRFIPLDTVVVDRLSPQLAFVASLMPSLMHDVGRRLLAERLCRANPALHIDLDAQLVLEAVTASAARENVNYQRLEFLGDAVLGFFISLMLLSQYPKWHEGYLTQGRSQLVSNSRLATAAQESGVARYLQLTAFTGVKWIPPHNEAFNETITKDPQRVSTKTLADIVEAIIAASCVGSNIAQAQPMIKAFLYDPNVPLSWKPFDESVRDLQVRVGDVPLPSYMEPLQKLIGYQFTRPALLLEAITHGSSLSQSGVMSYERFEFAGDSILSVIITRAIFAHPKTLSVSRMHLLRTATVNGDFLAFMAMCLTVVETRKDVHLRKAGIEGKQDEYVVQETEQVISLHDFLMHHPSEAFAAAKRDSLKRFEEQRSSIESTMAAGKKYPWVQLATFAPEKFFSDIVESIL